MCTCSRRWDYQRLLGGLTWLKLKTHDWRPAATPSGLAQMPSAWMWWQVASCSILPLPFNCPSLPFLNTFTVIDNPTITGSQELLQIHLPSFTHHVHLWNLDFIVPSCPAIGLTFFYACFFFFWFIDSLPAADKKFGRSAAKMQCAAVAIFHKQRRQ